MRMNRGFVILRSEDQMVMETEVRGRHSDRRLDYVTVLEPINHTTETLAFGFGQDGNLRDVHC